MKQDNPHIEPATVELAPTTHAHYQRLFQRMLTQGRERRWTGEIEYIYPLTYREMIDDLLENPRKWKRHTLHKMRAALLYCIEGENADELKSILRSPEFMEAMNLAGGPGNPNSRTRGRHIPEKDFKLIVERLERKKHIEGQRQLLNCLKATVAAGARPVEWLNAIWLDRPKGILRFRTAKDKTRNALNGHSFLPDVIYKEGRVTPTYRTVLIDKADIDVVDEHILTIRKIINNSEWGFTWENMPQDLRIQCTESFFNKMRITLRRVSNEVVGKNYSLYDARSTFAANRRARDGVKSASAELGHNPDKPNAETSRHYANSYKAWSQYKRSRKQSDTQTDQDLPNENQTMENDIPVTFNIPDFLTR